MIARKRQRNRLLADRTYFSDKSPPARGGWRQFFVCVRATWCRSDTDINPDREQRAMLQSGKRDD